MHEVSQQSELNIRAELWGWKGNRGENKDKLLQKPDFYAFLILVLNVEPVPLFEKTLYDFLSVK